MKQHTGICIIKGSVRFCVRSVTVYLRHVKMLKERSYAQSKLQHIGYWTLLKKLAPPLHYDFHREHSLLK